MPVLVRSLRTRSRGHGIPARRALVRARRKEETQPGTNLDLLLCSIERNERTLERKPYEQDPEALYHTL